MQKFVIIGPNKLNGEIEVGGAKNAATPILITTLLTDQKCIIDNIPLIEDVFRIIDILKSLGSEIEWLDKRKVAITNRNINLKKINFDLISQLRSSVFLFSALLSRFENFQIIKPGGCYLGARILDPHFDALMKFGINIKKDGQIYEFSRKDLIGSEIVMSEMSVTATENAVIAAILAKGKTVIKNAAAEPCVQDLCHFLNKMGAKISGIGTHRLEILGVKKLNGVNYTIIPDPIEMGTFLAMTAAAFSQSCLKRTAKNRVKIKNFVPEFLELELLKFREANVSFSYSNLRNSKTGWGYKIGEITIKPSELKAVKKVHNMPYPGFAPDLLPPFAVMLTQAKGMSLIHDWMYENRLKYIDELKRMGADAIICDPHRALITGPTKLTSREITSFDLRSGASLIIAGIIAEGKTIINDAYQVDRGYERIEERLQKIGVDIKRY